MPSSKLATRNPLEESGNICLLALPDELQSKVAAMCAEGMFGHLMPLRLACKRLRDASRKLMVHNERKRLCAIAAEGGHLKLLQWARANGCLWGKYTCASAAFGGHLEVLQWAHANGCPWNGLTCSDAAQGGHLEVLQWARANGCPWNASTCSNAAGSGQLEVILMQLFTN